MIVRGGPRRKRLRMDFIYIYTGRSWKGHGGGGISSFRNGLAEGVAVEEGYFFGHFFGLEGRTFM